MPLKSLVNYFHRTKANLQPLNTNPDISDDIQQTLARLLGWNTDLEEWQLVKVDTLGRLVVSTGEGTFTTFNVTKVSVGTSATSILNSNTSRNGFIIINLGASDMYIDKDSGVTTDDYPITVGKSFTIENYTGAIQGIVASGTADVRVIEY